MKERPNIVLLVGEDTGLHLGCYGNRDAHTPNLDQLAADGVRYTAAYSTAPVCAPSRCTMVTGKYAWSIGAQHMRSTLINPPRLFTQELQAGGYAVAWPTKTDFNIEPPADLCTTTQEWWDDDFPDQPFFAYRNLSVTHESTMWDAGEGLPGGYQKWTADLPADRRVDPATVRVPAYLPDVPDVRIELARYFEALAVQDMQVGQTLEAIDRAGLRDSTVVIYLTDHGRGLAREKRWCYDAGVHLPLIVRWPKRERAGTVNDSVVSWVDLAPTILEIAGIAPPADYQGQSFLSGTRRYALSGRDRMDESFDRVRSITDGRFRYIRNDFPHIPYAQRNQYQQNSRATQALRRLDADGTLVSPADVYMQRTKPPEELYDATTDPDMVHNLAGDPSQDGKRTELRDALTAELARFGDLGEIDETELIARGIVVDRLDNEYRKRIQPLPEPYHSRTGPTVLTRDEALRTRPSL